MTYGSLFSGIGGFDLGFDRAGMTCLWQMEFDKNCNHVLRRNWPGVTRYGDITQTDARELPVPDIICGGFPCQDLSVAGKRAGLAGERSGLWFEFLRVLWDIKATWVVIENVPGLLFSNRGRDFAIILHGLEECGYFVAWRVLDAKYFGVPQRRRRVIIVGHLRDGRAAQVLFEPESVCGNPEKGRTARHGDTEEPIGGLNASGKYDRGDRKHNSHLIAAVSSKWAKQSGGPSGDECQNLIAFSSKDEGRDAMADVSPTLRSMNFKDARINGGGQVGIVGDFGVRRLTPRECERAQGFPDDWTRYGADENGNEIELSDSARYRMIGNAVAVPVAEWIGKRIDA